LQHEAVLGAILAMAVILIFLRNVRGTSIIFVAIPLAILITFIFFRFGDVTLNIMTFGGLALAVGRLVDDSVVELEVISRHYKRMSEGQTKLQATLDAAKEVAAPIFVSTLTTVIVFLPVVFLTGVAKLLFVPLTITIAVSLFGSFFVSRTITPLMCLNFLPPERVRDPQSTRLSDRLGIAMSNLIEKVESVYQKALEWALSNRRTVVFGVAGATLVTLGMWVVLGTKFIGTEFFPDQDEGQFSLTVRTPVGTRVEETQKVCVQIENIIKANVPEMEAMITDIGIPSTGKGGSLFGRNSGTHSANIQVALIPIDKRKRSVFEVVNALRPKLQTVVGAQVYITTGGFLHFLLNFGSSAPIDVEVRGYDLDTGMRLATRILPIVRETPGATDVLVSREDNLPELRVNIDRNKAGILGITASQISNTIATSVNGTDASLYTDPVTGNQYNILVRLNEDYRSNIEDLKNLILTTQSGQPVLLGSVASVEKANSPVEIDRKYQQRLVEVTANVTGRDLGSVANDIRAKLAGISIPPGFEIRLTGNVEQQGKTFSDLLLAFALAILLVYVVMASQFQSLLDPFVIMFTVPLGFVGVLWMLFLTNTTLSVTSFQGVIVMVGIVVSNGILLVDYTNHRRRAGEELHVAVVRAGRTRLRPILMTTLATVLGLIPLAIGIGGESSQAPLAIAVIGGLTVSTFLTLLFIPTIYTIFEERVKRGNKQLRSNEAGSK
jgi:multidrug efflux pump subunit AcrB